MGIDWNLACWEGVSWGKQTAKTALLAVDDMITCCSRKFSYFLCVKGHSDNVCKL